MENYRRILDVLRSVPNVVSVTPIAPVGHEALSFFPGQRGFAGPSFPINGLMLVANNFDNLTGWESYRNDPTKRDPTPSFRRLIEYIIPAIGIHLDKCWLTNYCLGVMDRPDSQYQFPSAIRKALELDAKFDECVDIMQPRLIVAMGSYAAKCLRATKEPMLRGNKKIMAIDHPGRWHKGREYFEAEGVRIREIWEAS